MSNYWKRIVKKEKDFIIIIGDDFEISIKAQDIKYISFSHFAYGMMTIKIMNKDSKEFEFTCENKRDAHEICEIIRNLL